MDDLDVKLIGLLRRDCRQSIFALAQALGVSRATVRARMSRLEKSGEIVGYTAVLRADLFGLPVRGIMLIHIQGPADEKVIDALRGFPEITAIHKTNGRWDLIVELATGDLNAFDAVLRRTRLIPGVTATETNLLLATPHQAGTPRR